MRQTILTAAAAFLIGGIATGAVLSQAQPAPPDHPPGMLMNGHPGADGRPGFAADGPMPWMHRHHAMMEGGPAEGRRALGLVYREKDRALSAADVQKIAEAFLLWNGNHTWKVANVAPTQDGQIGFSLTTQEGSVIARFTMDPHTARLTRVG